MLKVKIIVNYRSLSELEKEVNDFINREEVGRVLEVQLDGNAVLIMYEEYDPLNPNTY